jgi:hypothetical protein
MEPGFIPIVKSKKPPMKLNIIRAKAPMKELISSLKSHLIGFISIVSKIITTIKIKRYAITVS